MTRQVHAKSTLTSAALLAVMLEQTELAVQFAQDHGKQAAYRYLGLVSAPADSGLLTNADAQAYYKASLVALDKVHASE
jgi:hypothetical protein